MRRHLAMRVEHRANREVYSLTNAAPWVGGRMQELFVGLITFFAFPAIQFVLLKRFARREGRPELWYLPRYGYRLVIHNISGRKMLSELRCRTILRHYIQPENGASVVTLQDTPLNEKEDMFLFPGTDQVLLSFRLEEVASQLVLIHTDKVGTELGRFELGDHDRLITDYIANIENLFNFDIRLAKRAELKGATMRSMARVRGDEQELRLDRIRDVG
jgi:hypothetical protein